MVEAILFLCCEPIGQKNANCQLPIVNYFVPLHVLRFSKDDF